MVKTSSNGGRTWGDPKKLPLGILGPIKNKPVQLKSGDILSGVSTEHDGWRVHFERSSDLGDTWTTTQPLNDGRKLGAIQPAILMHKDGRLQAVGRSKQGKVFQLWSTDQGRTWSEMTLLELPNPNAGIDAVTLADGRHLLVYNHTTQGRSPLNVTLSKNGVDWVPGPVLESEPGEYSYPAAIQAPDGKVHITYTWKRQRIRHVVLDPAALPAL
jgi:predicted neuraminidase